MTATKTDRKTKFTVSHRKEKAGLHRGYKVIDQDFNEVIDCRIYWPNNTVYCALWIHGGDYASGTGKAGGCGYCKQSGAVSDAIYNSGYDLSENIHGVGLGAIKDALLAIAQTVTDKPLHIVEMYG